MTPQIAWLGDDPAGPFPPANTALREPYDGLLAAGGDLQPTRLINAYRQGIFPWFSEGEPILWWCPDPRMVFRTHTLLPNKRFRRELRQCDWTIRADTAFEQVIAACAQTPRSGQAGTWITDEMIAAYTVLHRLGYAHSIEVFDGAGDLVGGLYGVAIGRMFFGESMVSLRTGGSKTAIFALARQLSCWGWPLIDAQVVSPHLETLGAQRWPRAQFLNEIEQLVVADASPASWTAGFGRMPAACLAEGVDKQHFCAKTQVVAQ